MSKQTLNAKVRTASGKTAAKRLRQVGSIPAVMYNDKGEATMLEVNEVEFNKIWRTITPSTSDTTINKNQWIKNNNIVIKGDANLIASNIINGVTIFGVTGTHQESGSGSETYYKCVSVTIAQAVENESVLVTGIGEFNGVYVVIHPYNTSFKAWSKDNDTYRIMEDDDDSWCIYKK